MQSLGESLRRKLDGERRRTFRIQGKTGERKTAFGDLFRHERINGPQVRRCNQQPIRNLCGKWGKDKPQARRASVAATDDLPQADRHQSSAIRELHDQFGTLRRIEPPLSRAGSPFSLFEYNRLLW